MNTRLIAASIALSLALSACGNKGPLIKPSQVPPPAPAAESMPVPPDTNPVDPAPQDQAVPAATDATDPEAVPETPAADDGNG